MDGQSGRDGHGRRTLTGRASGEQQGRASWRPIQLHPPCTATCLWMTIPHRTGCRYPIRRNSIIRSLGGNLEPRHSVVCPLGGCPRTKRGDERLPVELRRRILARIGDGSRRDRRAHSRRRLDGSELSPADLRRDEQQTKKQGAPMHHDILAIHGFVTWRLSVPVATPLGSTKTVYVSVAGKVTCARLKLAAALQV